MKPAFLTKLLLLAAATLPLNDSLAANKMNPGYKNYKKPGLNANAKCRRPQFNICQGCNITIPMKVLQDRACGFNFSSLGPFAGQEVTVAPRNGSYSLVNETKAVYRPNAGFTGEDHFESRLYFKEGSGKRTFLNLKVNVSVVPNL